MEKNNTASSPGHNSLPELSRAQDFNSDHAQPILSLQSVSLGWRGKWAVRDATGVFSKGGLYAVVGPNGAGKSTFLNALVGQLPPAQGQIEHAGDVRFAYLPQYHGLDLSFPMSVYDFVALGLWSQVGAFRALSSAQHTQVQQALQQVGLLDFAGRLLGTLSGGQLQRVLFARVAVQQAEVVLLDEPFSAVDEATSVQLLDIVLQWHQRGKTVIAVLHDLEMVRAYFPQTVLLAGQVIEWGPTQQVLSEENLHLARHLCAGDFL